MTDTIEDEAIHFLKRQGFYIVIVLAVTAVSMADTYNALWSSSPRIDTSSVRVSNPIDQKELRLQLARNATDLSRRQLARILPYHLMRFLNVALLGVGTVVAASLVIFKILKFFDDVPAAPPTLAREVPWGLWDVVKAYALFQAGSWLLHYILSRHQFEPLMHPSDWVVVILANTLLAGVVIHIVMEEKSGRLSDLGIRGKFLTALGLALLAFLVLQPFIRLTETLQMWFHEQMPLQESAEAVLRTRSPFVLALAWVTAAAAAPMVEELFFRGFLMPALQRWTGAVGGIVMSAAFFSVMHFDLYAIPILFLLGLALGYVYHRSRTLVAPIALHMFFNLASIGMLSASRLVLSQAQ